jgi:hypothetical protein
MWVVACILETDNIRDVAGCLKEKAGLVTRLSAVLVDDCDKDSGWERQKVTWHPHPRAVSGSMSYASAITAPERWR